MKSNHRLAAILLIFGLALLSAGAIWLWGGSPSSPTTTGQAFNADRAYQDVLYQVDLGPRTPGSPGHDQAVDWIVNELTENGWETRIQEAEMLGHPIRNVVGSWGDGSRPWVILGAHFDTRMLADNDPDPSLRTSPVPGANDGASGVAVLLELARVLPPQPDKTIWLVFFDAEDNGNLPGWDWILGSQAFVQSLEGSPDAAIIVDMVGDMDLTLYLEQNSDPVLREQIWETARILGFEGQFIPRLKYAITDDHIPFVRAGIPAVDIIDLDYAYWHTTMDTPDKVAPESLRAVGQTLLEWLEVYAIP